MNSEQINRPPLAGTTWSGFREGTPLSPLQARALDGTPAVLQVRLPSGRPADAVIATRPASSDGPPPVILGLARPKPDDLELWEPMPPSNAGETLWAWNELTRTAHRIPATPSP